MPVLTVKAVRTGGVTVTSSSVIVTDVLAEPESKVTSVSEGVPISTLKDSLSSSTLSCVMEMSAVLMARYRVLPSRSIWAKSDSEKVSVVSIPV